MQKVGKRKRESKYTCQIRPCTRKGQLLTKTVYQMQTKPKKQHLYLIQWKWPLGGEVGVKELCNSLLFSTQDRSEDCPEERVETLCLKQSYLNVKALTKYWLVDSVRVNTYRDSMKAALFSIRNFYTQHHIWKWWDWWWSKDHGLRAVVQAGSIHHTHKWNFHHLLCVSKTLLISLYILSQWSYISQTTRHMFPMVSYENADRFKSLKVKGLLPRSKLMSIQTSAT